MGVAVKLSINKKETTYPIVIMTSLVFLKYSSSGLGENRPLEIGDKIWIRREMEMAGGLEYKRLRWQLERLRWEMEKLKAVKYYKSQMAIRTVKSTGGIFFSYPVAREG